MPRPKSDTDLIAAIRGGNLAAFSEIVSRYQQVVCAVAFSACGSRALSEDVAQDTFVAAWKNMEKLQDEKKLKGWLCSIARHKAKDALRKRHRETLVKDDSEEFRTQESDAPSPFQRAASVEEESQVWSALKELPESYREALVLYYREEQSVSQVAEGLDLSIDAVKQRLRRGRAALKQSMDQVSHCLARTQPSKAFGVGVIAAIAAQSGVAQAAASQSANTAPTLSRAATHKGAAGGTFLQAMAWLALCIGGAAAVWMALPSSSSSAPAGSDEATSQRPAAQALGVQRTATSEKQASFERSGSLGLEGIVMDVFQRPVAGATLRLEGEVERRMVSGEDGSFRFDELPDGEYRIKAQSSDGSSREQVLQLDGEDDAIVLTILEGTSLDLSLIDAHSGAPIEGASLTLLSGSSEEQQHSDDDGAVTFNGITEFRNLIRIDAEGYAPVRLPVETSGMPGRQERQLRMLRGEPVSGRVVDRRGRPVAGAKVAVEPHVPGPRYAETKSDERGYFAFDAIAAEDSLLVITHDAFAWSTLPLDPQMIEGEEELELTMHPGRDVSGIVRLPDGRPAPGAMVVSNPSGKHILCDAEGRFSLRGLEAEEESLLASHGARGSAPVSILRAKKGTPSSKVEILLQDTAIEGRVLDEDGQPIVGAIVRADRRFEEMERFHSRLENAQDRTDREGRFRLGGLPAEGNFELQAIRPGASPMFLHQIRTDGVHVPSGTQDVEIVLEEPGLLRASLHSSLGEVERFSVTLANLREDLEFSASFPFEDTDEEFAIEDIPPGRYAVAIVAAGHEPKVYEGMEIGAGDTIDLGTLELRKGRTLRGRVVDAKGASVADARVLLGNMIVADESRLLLIDSLRDDGVDPLAARANSSIELRTDDEGRFVAENVYAGDIPLFIAAEESFAGRSRVEELGKANEIEIRLDPTASLSGELLGIEEGGDRDISVTVHPLRKERGKRFEALEIRVQARDGHFEISGLRPGQYLIAAHRSRVVPDLRNAIELTLEPGSHRDLRVEVQTKSLPMWSEETIADYAAELEELCRCSDDACRDEVSARLDAISDAHSDLTPRLFEELMSLDDKREQCEGIAPL